MNYRKYRGSKWLRINVYDRSNTTSIYFELYATTSDKGCHISMLEKHTKHIDNFEENDTTKEVFYGHTYYTSDFYPYAGEHKLRCCEVCKTSSKDEITDMCQTANVENFSSEVNTVNKKKGRNIMTYKEMTKKYEECGLTNYQLKSLDDLKAIHGVNVLELSGYAELSDGYKELFDRTVIRFFNAWGLNNRKELKPKNIHYVTEIVYEKKVSDDEVVDAGIEIFVIDIETGTKKRRLHRYVFEKDIPFKECEKHTKHYLCFELKGEWYHITENGE